MCFLIVPKLLVFFPIISTTFDVESDTPCASLHLQAADYEPPIMMSSRRFLSFPLPSKLASIPFLSPQLPHLAAHVVFVNATIKSSVRTVAHKAGTLAFTINYTLKLFASRTVISYIIHLLCNTFFMLIGAASDLTLHTPRLLCQQVQTSGKPP